MASTSRAVPKWRPTFQLDGKPLSATASMHVWDKGEGGRVTHSLVHDLLLPEDVNAFEEGIDKSMGRRLQWHIIAVISCFSVYH